MRFKDDEFGYSGLSGDQFFHPESTGFGLPAPANSSSFIGPIPTPDHWSSGAAGTPAFDPRTNAARPSWGDNLMTIGEIVSPYLSHLTGIDTIRTFSGLRQAARQKRQDELQQRQYQDLAERRKRVTAVQDAQIEQQKLQLGLEMAQKAGKMSPALRKYFLEQGMNVAGLQLDPGLMKAIEGEGEAEREAIYQGITQIAKEYGLDGTALSEIAKTRPDLAQEMLINLAKARKDKTERETSSRVQSILGGSGQDTPSEAPGSPPAGPQGQAAPQVTPTPLKPSERRSQVETMIDQIAAEEGVDPRILKTIAAIETSGYDSKAVSPAGARGLMQFMPATAKRFGVNPHDDASAVRGAARYVNFLSKKFGGNPDLILAGYNAGEGNVEKHGGVPPFRETRGYVEKGRSILAGLGQRQGAPLVAQDAPSSMQDTEPRLPVAPATPTQGSAPQSDQTVKLEKVETALAEMARKEEALLQLPPDDPAVKRGLATIKARRAELERQKAKYEKAIDKAGADEKEVGTQEFRAFVKSQTDVPYSQLPREERERLFVQYKQDQSRLQTETAANTGKAAAEIAAGRLTEERRKALRLDAEHNGLKLPVGSDKQIIEFAERNGLQGRDQMAQEESKTMRLRKNAHDTLKDLREGLGTVDQGVIAGPVQRLLDKFALTDASKRDLRAAYRALQAKVNAEVRSELIGAAQTKQELANIEPFLPTESDNPEVALGKLNAAIAFLQKQQQTDEVSYTEQLKAVPPSLRLPTTDLQHLRFETPGTGTGLKVDSSKLPTLGGVPPKNAEAVDALRRRLGIGAQQ